jgi:flagellar assembly factor FliW
LVHLLVKPGKEHPQKAAKPCKYKPEMLSAYHVLRAIPMNCTETTEPRTLGSSSECPIEMPLGLLGLERFKRFSLVTHPEEEPFLWLQVAGEPDLAFLVMSPFVVLPAYQPEIADEDARFLELQSPDDTLIFAIVTVRSGQDATINLKGPIVLNRRTLRAKQVIPVNASNFQVTYPLPVQTA